MYSSFFYKESLLNSDSVITFFKSISSLKKPKLNCNLSIFYDFSVKDPSTLKYSSFNSSVYFFISSSDILSSSLKKSLFYLSSFLDTKIKYFFQSFSSYPSLSKSFVLPKFTNKISLTYFLNV